MGPTIIARNYAETLFALAHQNGGMTTAEEYADSIAEVAEMLRDEPRLRRFLETPRVPLRAKQAAIREAFGDRSDEGFIRFLLVVLEKRRQSLLKEIASEYQGLMDEAKDRVRAEVFLAQMPDGDLEREIVQSLENGLGKSVIAEFQADPEILGGVVIRVGDQIFDGSLRRHLVAMRRRMVRAEIPAGQL
ncbi:MAG TPA: ATP synthase F1 subunit delta [Longimicrobiaceae bacterium]|nr:ATP synthase F1 subunit delta [Longimicrobiaceae bacterium]